MIRALPIIVSLLGGVGLGLGCGYLVLVVHAFGPQGQGAVEFLVGASDEKLSFGFAIVLVPYMLLMLHLWMRIRVGAWLADAGEWDRAENYATGRTNHTLLRAAKEALANRTVLLRVAAHKRDYDTGADLVADSVQLAQKRAGTFAVAFRRWAMEIHLRRDNLVEAKRHRDALGVPKERSAEAAGFCAAAAEIALREGAEDSAREWLERADYACDGLPRTAYARGLCGLRFGATDDARRDALRELSAAEPWLSQMPGASGEVLAARAELHRTLGNDDDAVRTLAGADGPFDRRSSFLFEQTTSSPEVSGDATAEEE